MVREKHKYVPPVACLGHESESVKRIWKWSTTDATQTQEVQRLKGFRIEVLDVEQRLCVLHALKVINSVSTWSCHVGKEKKLISDCARAVISDLCTSVLTLIWTMLQLQLLVYAWTEKNINAT